MAVHPALALLEFDSVAAGIVAGDAMVKRAPITALHTGTVQPGHYLVLIAGEVGDVVKGATVDLLEMHLADGLGGRGYLLFGGTVSDVEAAVSIGSGRVPPGHLVREAVISRLHPEMRSDLEQSPRFGPSVGRGGDGDAAR